MHSTKRKQITSPEEPTKSERVQDTNRSIKSRLGGFADETTKRTTSRKSEEKPLKKRSEVTWSDDEDRIPVKKVQVTSNGRQRLSAPGETAHNLLSSIANSLTSTPTEQVKRRLGPQREADTKPSIRQNQIADPNQSLSTGRLERFLHDIDSSTPLTSGLIDTHMHIDFTLSMFNATDLKWSDFTKRYSARFPPCYEGSIASFSNPETFSSSNTMLNEVAKSNRLWMSFGVHPHFADKFSEDKLRACLHKFKSRVVALGEIGLDTSSKNQVSLEVQKDTFRIQAEIGIECSLPLVIHTRVSDSNEETLKFIRKFVPRDYKVHRHCFNGTWEEANDWLMQFQNCYIGFTTLINSQPELMKVAARVPFDRIVLETDAPYFKTGLPPLELGGRTIGTLPGDVLYTAVGLAKAKNISLESVICQTRLNVKNLYGI